MKTPTQTQCILIPGIVALLLCTISCSKSDDDNKDVKKSDIDLSGYWKTYSARSDETETGPGIYIINQNNDSISFETPCLNVVAKGVINENEITLTMEDSETDNPNNVYFDIDIINDDSISGVWTEDGPFTGTLRATRITLTTVNNLSGSWQLFQTKTGQTEEGPMAISLTQNNNDLEFNITIDQNSSNGEGVVAGAIINLWFTEQADKKIILFGEHKEDTLKGTWIEEGPSSGAWRAIRNN